MSEDKREYNRRYQKERWDNDPEFRRKKMAASKARIQRIREEVKEMRRERETQNSTHSAWSHTGASGQ